MYVEVPYALGNPIRKSFSQRIKLQEKQEGVGGKWRILVVFTLKQGYTTWCGLKWNITALSFNLTPGSSAGEFGPEQHNRCYAVHCFYQEYWHTATHTQGSYICLDLHEQRARLNKITYLTGRPGLQNEPASHTKISQLWEFNSIYLHIIITQRDINGPENLQSVSITKSKKC